MKTLIFLRFLGIILSCTVCPLSQTSFAASTADPNANAKTRALYNYLYNLPTGSSNRILSGQFTQDMSDTTGIYNTSGKNVAILGVEYEWSRPPNTNISNWANSGGVIALSAHLKNPATGGTAFDTTNVDLPQVVTPGTALNTAYNHDLDGLAAWIQSFGDTPMLFRTLHEMADGTWFWWGVKGGTQYTALWRYTFDYLTTAKGLHNLIWTWAPNAVFDWSYYPGSSYVDIVGLDLYGQGNSFSQPSGYSSIPDNKPFAIAEWGECPGGITWTPSACIPPSISSSLMSTLKNAMPKAIYMLAWNGVYSLNYATNVSTYLNDAWIITRDEVPTITGIIDTTPPAAPRGVRVP